MATRLHTEFIPELPPLLPPTRPPVPHSSAAVQTKKKLVRRTDRDYSQALRRSFQFVFLAWNVYLGGACYI